MGGEGYSGCMYVYMFVRECICKYVLMCMVSQFQLPKINPITVMGDYKSFQNIVFLTKS